MNSYPKVTVNLNKIKHNTQILAQICNANNIDLVAVTKVFCGNHEIAKAVVEGGAKMLADSRLKNLIKLKDIDIPKIYLRLPMMCEIDEVIKYADISFNSEITIIEKLSECAVSQNKIHDIVLMVDMGDLREGLWPTDIFDTVEKTLKLSGIRIVGIGTNLGCYGGVLHTEDNLEKLCSISRSIREKFDIDFQIISGGNSGIIYLLLDSKVPKEINNIRVGGAIVHGYNMTEGKPIENMYHDVFTLEAQIIELKKKPSIPIGEIGLDAFGNKPFFENKGVRNRAIISIGKQDIYPDRIIPTDKDILIIGASSDHLILDVTDSKTEYKVGDVVSFYLKYPAILQSFTSEYVLKEFLK